VGLIACLAVVIGSTIYIIAARRDPMVAPKGVRNLAEVGVEFIEDQIVMQTIGRDGLGWTPFLLTLFIFVYLCNLPGSSPSCSSRPRRGWPSRCSSPRWSG
jgi:F-type H+-transporting ATPase subunit a